MKIIYLVWVLLVSSELFANGGIVCSTGGDGKSGGNEYTDE
jgi:hypothetical protein